MFVGGSRRGVRPSAAAAVFRCDRCSTPIELERVVGADIERGDDGVTGFVLFEHHCPCSPESVVVTRAWATHAAFVALFGSQPWLPYRAPFSYGQVADDDPVLGRWRWELEQVADASEFLLFLGDASRPAA